MTSSANDKIKPDDWLRLNVDTDSDVDLNIIADMLEDEFGEEAGFIVMPYWVQLLRIAKKAKCFGWFEATPRQIAVRMRDRSNGRTEWWNERRRLLELLAERGHIVIRQGVPATPHQKVDIRIVRWSKWQSLSTRETSKLHRERSRLENDVSPHWTMEHLPEFDSRDGNRSPRDDFRSPFPDSRHNVTTRDETREGQERSDGLLSSMAMANYLGALDLGGSVRARLKAVSADQFQAWLDAGTPSGWVVEFEELADWTPDPAPALREVPPPSAMRGSLRVVTGEAAERTPSVSGRDVVVALPIRTQSHDEDPVPA